MANNNNTEPKYDKVTKERVKKIGSAVKYYEKKYGRNREKWPADGKEVVKAEKKLVQDMKAHQQDVLDRVSNLIVNENKKPVEERDYEKLEEYNTTYDQVDEFGKNFEKTRHVYNIKGSENYEYGGEPDFWDKLEQGILFGQGYSGAHYDKILDLDYNKLGEWEQLDSGLDETTKEPPAPTDGGRPTTQNRGGLEQMRQDKSQSVADKVDNLDDPTYEDTVTTPKEEDTSRYSTDVAGEAPKVEGEYDDGIGLIDYLQPAGQVLTGLIGASEPLPDPSMSPEMRTIIDEDMARRNQGLSRAEIDERNKMAERGYAYDVSNIRRMSGGSAGAALANLGRAAGTLQDQYGRTAAEDERMRQVNRQHARGASQNAENFERYAFGIEYNEAMRNAEASGQLASMGMDELKKLRQDERYYGEDSAYGKLMKDLDWRRKYEKQLLENMQETNKTIFEKEGGTNQGETTNTNANTSNESQTQVAEVNAETPSETQTTSMNDVAPKGAQEVDLSGMQNEPGSALVNQEETQYDEDKDIVVKSSPYSTDNQTDENSNDDTNNDIVLKSEPYKMLPTEDEEGNFIEENFEENFKNIEKTAKVTDVEELNPGVIKQQISNAKALLKQYQDRSEKEGDEYDIKAKKVQENIDKLNSKKKGYNVGQSEQKDFDVINTNISSGNDLSENAKELDKVDETKPEVKKELEENVVKVIGKSKGVKKKAVEEIAKKDLKAVNNPIYYANKYLGFDETNSNHQETIQGFINNAVGSKWAKKSDVAKDDYAWCAAFVNNVLKESNIKVNLGNNKWDNIRAKSYGSLGEPIENISSAQPGDIVVIKNKNGGHHVAFYAGKKDGNNLLLGGNQNDRVSVMELNNDTHTVVNVRRLKNIEQMSEDDLSIIQGTEYYDKVDSETTTR